MHFTSFYTFFINDLLNSTKITIFKPNYHLSTYIAKV